MSVLAAEVAYRGRGLLLEARLGVEEGITALFGPSGAGKTTLLHCLAGLRRPQRGRIVLRGRVLFDARARIDVPPQRRGIGIVFQDVRLFPHLSVEENLRYGERARCAWKPGRRGPRGGRVGPSPERVLELLELGSLLRRRPATLSGGEARRVALGRALLAARKLLLLDEPLAGLDEARKGAVLRLLAHIRAEFGLPILLVSHSLPEILQITTRVVVLEGGKVIGEGDLYDVLGRERVFRLADALGLESFLEVEIVGSDPQGGTTRARLGERELTLPLVEKLPGTRALVAVRPEDVILATGEIRGISARNALEGTVTRVARLPDRLLVSIDVGQILRAEITARSGRELGIVPGARVYCLVKAFAFRWRRFFERGAQRPRPVGSEAPPTSPDPPGAGGCRRASGSSGGAG